MLYTPELVSGEMIVPYARLRMLHDDFMDAIYGSSDGCIRPRY